MKIKSLVFEAFGPYTNKVSLDFSSLNDAELFLITGDTGAGKTTIFDAVCFALYGVSSGDVRQISQFRNQRADAKTETYVCLTFTIRGHDYTITRYPNYAREGYKTESRHRAYLEGDGDHTIEGVNEVNTRVKEIIGVDADEFRQVAMIAQGRFTSLIHAPSKEREAILRELFSTHAYAAFQENLKKAEKQEKENYTEKKMKLDTYLEELKLDSAAEALHLLSEKTQKLQDDLKQLEKTQLEKNEKLENVQKSLEEALKQEEWKAQLAQLKMREASLQEQEEDMQLASDQMNLLLACQNVQPYYENYLKSSQSFKKVSLQLSQLQEQEQQLLEDFSVLEAKKTEMQEKEKDLALLEHQLEKVNEDLNQVERFEKAKNLARQAGLQVEAVQRELASNQDQKKELEAILQKCQQDLQALSHLEAAKISLTHQSNLLKMDGQKIDNLEKIQQKIDSLQLGLKKKQEVWEKAGTLHRQKNDEQLQMEKHYQASLAGLLASQLKEDEPCPVCGSLHHPALAILPEDAITQEMLESHRQEVQKAAAALQQAFGDLMAQKQALEMQEKIFKENLGEHSLKERMDQYHEALQAFEKARETYMNDSKRQEQLVSYQKDYEKRYEVCQAKNEKILENLTKVKENQQKRNEAFEYIRGSFNETFESFDILVKKKMQLDRNRKNWRKELEDYKNQSTACVNELQKRQGEISAVSAEKQKAEYALNENQLRYTKQLASYQIDEACLIENLDQLGQLAALKEKTEAYDKQCFVVASSITDYENRLARAVLLDIEQLRKQKEDLDQEMAAIKVTAEKHHWELEKAQQQFKNIRSAGKSYDESQKKYQEIYEISRLVSGQNPSRMTFESYILAAYFEAILERANLRFVAMTNGRYALLRKEEQLSGRSLQGLDLNVMDYESGKARDVRTLSGGETFKAALSLALGMADLISENAGGIELDTLFIDEGFGSLDARSLDQALDTLIELKQEHKVVGIISHVAELKERLQAKILVTHDHSTSVAKVV